MLTIQPNQPYNAANAWSTLSLGEGQCREQTREGLGAPYHHATLPCHRRTSAPAARALEGDILGQLDVGTAGAEAGQKAARKAPHREPFTLPCISSRMVRVTFRPPSETLDSISYQGTGDVR